MNLQLLLVLALFTLSVTASAYVPKKIILSFDGTGNSLKLQKPDPIGNHHLTNVLKIHLLAGGDINNKRNDVEGQVCIYNRGVGASSKNKYVRKIFGILGMIGQQTRPMHKKFKKAYNEGDEVYVIGFSRGAAAARRFVSELNDKSIDVKFLGVFDTVSMQLSLNLPRILFNVVWRKRLVSCTVLKEHGGKLPANVGKAFHSLALDENRALRSPVYMDSNDPRVYESFFPGSHANVGGGFYDKGLSDSACMDMIERLKQEGITFLDHKDVNLGCLERDDDRDAKISQEDLLIEPDMTSIQYKVNGTNVRPVECLTNNKKIDGAKVKIHKSVLEHYEQFANTESPYVPNPKLKSANFVVTGHLGEELPEATERLRSLLN